MNNEELIRALTTDTNYRPKVYTLDDRGHLVPVTGVKVQTMRDPEGDTPIFVIERQTN